MSSTLNAAAGTALASLPGLVGLIAGNKLAGVNTQIQSGITTAEGDVSGKITAMQSALDAEEKSNPLVAEAISAAVGVLNALGIQVPSEATVFQHVQAAANDLFGAVKAA